MKKLMIVVLVVLLLAPLSNSIVEAKEKGRDSSVKIVESITSQALVHDDTPKQNKLTYKIYLPKGYDSKREDGYPVIYLLHGSSGNENSWDGFWATLDNMIEEGIVEPVIAVVPSTGNSYWVDSEKFGHYEESMINDLIPHIDKKYNTKSERESRFISGFSMGGYGALRYSLVYPELFSGAILLSPAIQKGLPPITSGAVERGSFGTPFNPNRWEQLNYPAALESYVKQPFRVPFYIVTGDDDWNHLSEKEDLPLDAYKYNMEVQAVELYQELHRKNLFSKDFDKWEDVPSNPAELRIIDGGHGMDVWLQGFEEGLKYVFGKKEKDDFSPSYLAANYETPHKGTVHLRTFVSETLGKDHSQTEKTLSYNIYLPNGYHAAEVEKYPVIYLLHGSGGTASSWDRYWPILDKMIDDKVIGPVIAVAPITGNSYWVDSAKYGAVETSVVNDLIREIDTNFNTIASREGRGLAGYSMGGYGALRYSLIYPEKFAATTLLSPAIQDGEAPATSGAVERGSFGEPFDPEIWEKLNYPSALKIYSKQQYKVPMFIYAGDDDWNHLSEKEDLPPDANKYNMEVQAVSLYQYLHRSNIFNEGFEKWEDVPGSPAELRIVNGGHSSHVWGKGFEEGLQYMFQNGLSSVK
ncbi:hypothetical protein DRW41_01415 [Neobacillus piezotolerans]|uniref:Esterase n=1 Tax=Neobacillus piezotolerans TaxID=2259171 RepID=A0A3D8GV07_9BACI|nr:alpha/beta hydrolase-fold protein [Neobacillus piezotolerans]RDU38257.1 hypothetical protein DRW41_01415 [Neobacillus piezotolerans]